MRISLITKPFYEFFRTVKEIIYFSATLTKENAYSDIKAWLRLRDNNDMIF